MQREALRDTTTAEGPPDRTPHPSSSLAIMPGASCRKQPTTSSVLPREGCPHAAPAGEVGASQAGWFGCKCQGSSSAGSSGQSGQGWVLPRGSQGLEWAEAP